MIFQATWQQVLDGSKSETRRIVKDNEVSDRQLCIDANEWPDLHVHIPSKISAIYKACQTGSLRVQWQIGHTYAVQPGRGKKAVGRICILEICQERLQDITVNSAKCEGLREWAGIGNPPLGHYWVTQTPFDYPESFLITAATDGVIDAYAKLWNLLHPRKSEQWTANPLVWVLRFRLVEDEK